MYDDPKSKIGQLEKVLNAREDKVSKKAKVRHELHAHESTVPGEWDNSEFAVSDEEIDNNLGANEAKKMSLAIKILYGSLGFFILAILIVIIKFTFGGNIVSGDNIEVNVKAPISVAGGEMLPIEIEVVNENSVTLLGTDLGVTYPIGAMQANDISAPAKREQIFLGDIAPGDSVFKNLKVYLFGSENEKKEIKLTLEYKVTGSNSLFNKTKNVSVLVTSAPASVVVTGPTEVNTNQSVNYKVEVISNSTSVIKNLLLKVDYPFGFAFGDSDPGTYANKNNLWLIGDLAPGDKRTINIYGTVTGQEGEERGFNFNLGTRSATDNTVIATPLSTAFSSVTIRRPFVSADVFFNGNNSDSYVAQAGQKVETVIKWRNNLPYPVTDVSIAVKLNGNAIDKSGVQIDGGFYRSYDNTIIFDKTTDKTFASLEPGQSGESKFNLKSFDLGSITGTTLSSPSIYLDINVQGKTVNSGGKVENVSFADARTIKLTTNPRLSVKSLYYIGPFKNFGPIPPRADQETTYTIVWTVTNPLNPISGTRVVGTLPTYMTWIGQVSPASEKVDYDQNSRQVVWSLGNIPAGAGIFSPAREVAFQVAIRPSVTQIGSAPSLLNNINLSARDNFTTSNLSQSVDSVSTSLSNDPYFQADNDRVLK